MLAHSPFYHRTFLRYIKAFGTVFNDISIIRKFKDGKEKTIRVPIIYSKKDKAVHRFRVNPNLTEAWDGTWPKMAFEMTSQTYAGYRKQNSVTTPVRSVENGRVMVQRSPAPYDITFSLNIWTVYQEDMFQIVEQILPHFQPEFTLNVREIPDFEIERDIHIVLNSITMSDAIEGAFEDSTLFETTLDFTLKGFFFGPVSDAGGVIKDVTVRLFDTSSIEGAALTSTINIKGTEPGEHCVTTITVEGE